MQLAAPKAPTNLKQIGTFNQSAPAPLAIGADTRIGDSYTRLEEAVTAGQALSAGDAPALAVKRTQAGTFDLTTVYTQSSSKAFQPFSFESMRIGPWEFAIDANTGVKALVDGAKVFNFPSPDIFV